MEKTHLPFFNHLQSGQHRLTHRLRTRVAGVVVSALLAGSAMAWHDHRTQPITEAQRLTLTALADEAANRTGKTRQKVWAEMKIALGVRKIQDIQRKDFDIAREILLQEIR